MATSKDLNKFMNQQNKQFVGEKVEIEDKSTDDNFLSDREKAQSYDTKYATVGNDKAYATARSALITALKIPIIVAVMISIVLIIMRITPVILGYVRKILVVLMIGGN